MSVRRILGYIASIAALRLLLKFFGFGEKVALAYYFDLANLDAFTIAVSLPMIVMFLVSSVVNPALLPMFVRRLKQSPAGAWGQVHAWLLVCLLVTTAFGALALWQVNRVAWWLAPGLDPVRHALCVRMLGVTIPLSVLFGVQPLLATLLNAQRRFAYPPISEMAVKTATIAFMVLFAGKMGPFSALWGTVAGIALAVGLCLWGLLPSWRLRYAKPAYCDPDFRTVAFLMCAPGLGNIFSNIGTLVQNAACSTVEPGAVAALELARKLINMPLLIIPLASGTVLFTAFVELNQNGEKCASARLLGGSIRAMLFIFVPLALLTAILAKPAVAVVYQRGAFDETASSTVAQILFWLSPTMVLVSVETMLMQYFFAREMLWLPVSLGILSVIVRVLLIATLVPLLGVAAVTGAIVLSYTLKVTALLAAVHLRGGESARHFEIRELAKLVPAAAALVTVAWPIRILAGGMLGETLPQRLALLVLASVFGGLAYLGVAILLKSKECEYLRREIKWMPKRVVQSA